MRRCQAFEGICSSGVGCGKMAMFCVIGTNRSAAARWRQGPLS
ncbi:hypothetical protein HMPREF0345_0460 [Enterococcus faecalis ATCC 29200]|nr:hypothetical protein HMPREF0345_0460 [Enterococcus faecalis ATCC 29200]